MANPYVKQTWTDGVSALSAARLGVIETGIYDAHIQPAALAYHNATQAITNITETVVALNSERFDQDGLGTSTIHDNVTNNSRLTCRVAGVYAMGGQSGWAANPVNGGIWLRLNGATKIHTGQIPADYRSMQITGLYSLAVNDYIEMLIYQQSGGNLNTLAVAGSETMLWMYRVG